MDKNPKSIFLPDWKKKTYIGSRRLEPLGIRGAQIRALLEPFNTIVLFLRVLSYWIGALNWYIWLPTDGRLSDSYTTSDSCCFSSYGVLEPYRVCGYFGNFYFFVKKNLNWTLEISFFFDENFTCYTHFGKFGYFVCGGNCTT